MLEFDGLVRQCAPAVHPTTMSAVIRAESTFNPFAIGVVGGRLERQPRNGVEAIATAKALAAAGYDFSLGLGQINRYNLAKYGLDYERAFEPCANLRAASLILKECFERAKTMGLRKQGALQAAFSCYYSGNFTTGFQSGPEGQPSYVQRLLGGARLPPGTQWRPPMRAGPLVSAKGASGSAVAVPLFHDAPTRALSMAAESGSLDAVMVYR